MELIRYIGHFIIGIIYGLINYFVIVKGERNGKYSRIYKILVGCFLVAYCANIMLLVNLQFNEQFFIFTACIFAFLYIVYEVSSNLAIENTLKKVDTDATVQEDVENMQSEIKEARVIIIIVVICLVLMLFHQFYLSN